MEGGIEVSNSDRVAQELQAYDYYFTTRVLKYTLMVHRLWRPKTTSEMSIVTHSGEVKSKEPSIP